MDVSLKNQSNFENYYQGEYKDIVTHYYEIVKGKKLSTIILKIIFSIILSIISIILINKFNIKEILENYYSIVSIMYFIFIVLVTFFSIRNSLKEIMSELNEYIIKDMIAFISDNNIEDVMYEPKKKVSEESFDKMELFNLDVVKYNGKNYIKALYNKNSMVFSDMETYIIDTIETKKEIYKDGKKYIRTTRKKKKRGIFKGLYIGATLNKKNSNHIYLIPNNLNDTILQSKIMNYIKFHGASVQLENIDFSRKYKVFCDDEVQARYILSLSLMERINNLDELYKEKKYIVFKEGKRFAVCIEGISIENIKKIKLPLFRNQNKEINALMNMFIKLNDLFKIYYILDLGNDLYTKYMNKPINNITKENNSNNNQIEAKVNKIQESNKEKIEEKTNEQTSVNRDKISKDDFLGGWYN